VYVIRCILVALLSAFLCVSCWNDETNIAVSPQPASSPAFVDVTADVGIGHLHHRPVLDEKLSNIMSWMASVGATVASVDYDRDGWIDLYMTDARKGEPNRLYHNNGDGSFSDAGPGSGIAEVNGDAGTSMDAVFADYDGDGWPDLYLVRWGRDALYRNQGNGTFQEVTSELFRTHEGAPGMDWANGNAVIFLDYDLDGRLDIFVGNYFSPVDLWHLRDTLVMHDSFETARNGGPNFLFHQEADGRFREVAVQLALDDTGWALAVGSADVDNDGWPDIYVANDFGPDRLYLNNRDGSFTNASSTAIGHDTKKGMNVDFGDFNNDGWLDIFVSNITTAEYLQEGGMLWHNNGVGESGNLTLTDISLEAGTYDGGWGWGAKFFDYDNDGDLDLVGTNGFISAGEGSYWFDLASWTTDDENSTDSRNWPAIGDRSFSGYERMRLWHNDGMGSFTERASGLGLLSVGDGRGIAVLDYDNDGDLDLVIANQNQAPNFYRNEGSELGHWLVVSLERDPSGKTNPDAIGARVTLVMKDGGRMIRERDGGNGYSGQSDPRIHFGLGSADRIPLLEVRWPDGGVQYLEDVAADQHLTFRQDSSLYAAELRVEEARARPAPVSEKGTASIPEIAPEELERQLGEAERSLGGGNIGWAAGSAYRRLAATYAEHDRAIDFLHGLVGKFPTDGRRRVQLASAYVDKIPRCGGLAAVVCKGSLARKGLNQLDEVLEANPDSWIALYNRGMNHLHWPRALRHSRYAAKDFRRCIELQERSPDSRTFFVKPHISLGDALAKAGDYPDARQAWRRGQESFPNSQELAVRLEIEDDAALLDFIEATRSLERAIDTDLGFYDSK
jgi:tetratricopeptide (TPR) repeat protein